MNKKLNIHVYADGANKVDMVNRYKEGLVKGFTTNPTLMAKAGIKDYEAFAKDIVSAIPNRPISFEVFSDEFPEMKRQAAKIATWGEYVNVKIPITNTKGYSAIPLIEELLKEGVKLNVTAVFTKEQIDGLKKVIRSIDDVIISVFAGRIADAGQDPVPIMKYAVDLFKDQPNTKILWASSREAYNIIQAEECGCHIITVTDDLIKKMESFGKDLKDFSLDTVKMFYNDATKAGFRL